MFGGAVTLGIIDESTADVVSYRGAFRTDLLDGGASIFMIRRNTVDSTTGQLSTRWAPWNGIAGPGTSLSTQVGAVTTFPILTQANDIVLLGTAVGANVAGLYQRNSENSAWILFDFTSEDMPTRRRL